MRACCYVAELVCTGIGTRSTDRLNGASRSGTNRARGSTECSTDRGYGGADELWVPLFEKAYVKVLSYTDCEINPEKARSWYEWYMDCGVFAFDFAMHLPTHCFSI